VGGNITGEHSGAVPGIRDDDALWARQRRRIDDGEGNATVLIGASRTFFDVQLSTWERMSAAGRYSSRLMAHPLYSHSRTLLTILHSLAGY